MEPRQPAQKERANCEEHHMLVKGGLLEHIEDLGESKVILIHSPDS